MSSARQPRTLRQYYNSKRSNIIRLMWQSLQCHGIEFGFPRAAPQCTTCLARCEAPYRVLHVSRTKSM